MIEKMARGGRKSGRVAQVREGFSRLDGSFCDDFNFLRSVSFTFSGSNLGVSVHTDCHAYGHSDTPDKSKELASVVSWPQAETTVSL